MISLALQGPSNLLRPPVTQPLQARAPIGKSKQPLVIVYASPSHKPATPKQIYF